MASKIVAQNSSFFSWYDSSFFSPLKWFFFACSVQSADNRLVPSSARSSSSTDKTVKLESDSSSIVGKHQERSREDDDDVDDDIADSAVSSTSFSNIVPSHRTATVTSNGVYVVVRGFYLVLTQENNGKHDAAIQKTCATKITLLHRRNGIWTIFVFCSTSLGIVASGCVSIALVACGHVWLFHFIVDALRWICGMFSTSFAVAHTSPKALVRRHLSFDEKRLWLRERLAKLSATNNSTQRQAEQAVTLTVSRRSLLSSSCAALKNWSDEQIRSHVEIRFEVSVC